MDTMQAIMNNLAAQASGAQPRVFDWLKAAEIIRERKPLKAWAGLIEDWWWTADDIYSEGQPRPDATAYLASNWATPTLSLRFADEVREDIPCWRYLKDAPGWNAGTKWPPEALAVLRDEGISI